MINFIICFHTQWEVSFQIKFYPRTKFYSFHPGMKLTCKQKFFYPRTSRLHVNALLIFRELQRITVLYLIRYSLWTQAQYCIFKGMGGVFHFQFHIFDIVFSSTKTWTLCLVIPFKIKTIFSRPMIFKL